ncbi:MAG: hypothetical protein ABI411_19330 [Tahibacter sp.]
MATILTDTAATALWHDLVRDAERRGGAQLDVELESHLVFLLMRHLRDAQLGNTIFALDYLRALDEGGAQRSDALRELGDRCLLIAGLYPQQAQRRRVNLDYFLELGSRAYAELADASRTLWADLYRRIARTFARLARVLVEVRRLTQRDSLDALARHALCLADGDAIAREFPGAIVIGGTGTQLQ